MAVAGALFRQMVEHGDGIERLSRQYGRLLSFKDVQDLTGWGEKKLKAKIEDGTIPMVRDGEWFITWGAYLAAIDRYYMAHLPKRRLRAPR